MLPDHNPAKLHGGSKIRFHTIPTNWEGVSLGVTYTIVDVDCDGDAYFIDDEFELDYACNLPQYFDIIE